MEGQEPKVQPLSSHSSPIQVPSPVRAPLPKAEREVSMTKEVRKLLSWAALDMSGQASGNSTPKRLNPIVVLTLPSPKLGDFPRLVDTSSQVSVLDDAKMGDASLEETPTAISPTVKTPGPSAGIPPADVGHLQEEANQPLGDLLVTMSSINAHWQKLVWELSMALCQNESKTLESIREAKAVCAHATQEAKVLCSTTIKEVKATCAHSIQEAENLCCRIIREAGA